MNVEWLPYIKDIAVEIHGPYSCFYDGPEEDREEDDFDSPYYRVRFWSVAEHGDDLVVMIHFDPETHGLKGISPENPEYSEILDCAMSLSNEDELSFDFTQIERNYYIKISDLLEYVINSIENRSVAGITSATWKSIKKC